MRIFIVLFVMTVVTAVLYQVSVGYIEKRAYEQIVRESEQATLDSRVVDGVAYVAVTQKVPGIVCVKNMAVFQNAISQMCQLSGHRIVSAAPLGDPVMIKGEVAYPAMVFALLPVR